MSDVTVEGAAREVTTSFGTYSKDYWDNVFEQVGRRGFVKFALCVLALLYASAIYAPLIANDRPFRMRAINTKAYSRDLKTIYASTISLKGLAQKGQEQYLVDLEKNTQFRRYPTAVAEEAQGLARAAGELRELLIQRRAKDAERGARLGAALEASDEELAQTAPTLREWLSGVALLAQRVFVEEAPSGSLETEEARAALADLRAEMQSERERLEERVTKLDALIAADSEESGSEESGLSRIAAAAKEVEAALTEHPGSGDRAAAVRKDVRDVRGQIGDALVVSKLPEAGRQLVSEFVERAETLAHLEDVDEAKYRREMADEGLYRSFEETVREERRALAGFVTTVRSHLPPEHHARLGEFEQRADQVVAAILDDRREEAEGLAEQLKDEAKVLRTEYAPKDPAQPEGPGLELVPYTSYPLWESVSAVEIFFMTLWACVLAWPLWNAFLNRVVLGRDRERIRSWRKRKLWTVLGISLVAAVVWKFTVGGQVAFDSATFKEGLTHDEIRAADLDADVSFPALALGYAENHTDERFRPPTWHAESKIDDQGYYMSGPRVPKPDPVSGAMQPPAPVQVLVGEPARNSGWRHLLGTDSGGRDLLARLLYGGRISLMVGILSTVLLVFIGVVMGALAGYFGGWVDMTISRIIEIVQAFPAFFLILTAVALIPEDKVHPIFAIVFLIALVRWTGVARLVRGEFLRLREADFAMAARALGFSSARVIFRHVLPNALGPVLVAAAFSVASGILTESGISFLGLGIKQPIPSWGSVLNDSRAPEHWWIQVFPGFLIFITVFCYNVVGEGVRDALDPRRKV